MKTKTMNEPKINWRAVFKGLCNIFTILCVGIFLPFTLLFLDSFSEQTLLLFLSYVFVSPLYILFLTLWGFYRATYEISSHRLLNMSCIALIWCLVSIVAQAVISRDLTFFWVLYHFSYLFGVMLVACGLAGIVTKVPSVTLKSKSLTKGEQTYG